MPSIAGNTGAIGRLPLVLVFVVLPWLAGLFLLDAIHERAGQEFADEERDRRRDVLTRITVLGHAEKRYDELISTLLRTPLSLPVLARRAARLVGAEGGALELTLFDATPSLVSLPGFAPPPKRASERFMRALLAGGEDPQPKLLAAFGGDVDAARLMAGAPGSLVRLENAFVRSWGGWWPVRDRGGRVTGHLVGFVHRGRIDPAQLMDRAVRTARRLVGRAMTIGWAHPAAPDQLRPADVAWPAGLDRLIASAPPDLAELSWNGRSVLLVDGPLGERLFAIAPDAAPASGMSAPGGACAGISVAALLAALFVLGGGATFTARFGLRGRLIVLFAAGGGLLLAGLMTTVLFDREDRRRILIEECESRDLELLARIDQDFLSELFPALRVYELALEEGGRSGDAEAVARRIRRLMRRVRSFIDGIVVVDARPGVRLFDSGLGNGRAIAAMHSFLSEIGLGLMREFGGTAPTLSGDRKNPTLMTDIIANVLYYGIRAGRQFQFLMYLHKPMIIYAGVAASGGNVCAGLLVMHDPSRAQRKYLRRVVSRWPWSREGARFAALPLSPDPSWKAFPNAATGVDLELRRWRDRVAGERLPMHGITRIRGVEYLMTALPGTRLDGYALLIARPMQEIEKRTRELDRRMAGVSLGILALIIGVTAAVATRLLGPLERLETGLAAIRRRDFATRVRPGGVRELDRLGERVNLVAETLRDLEIARSVQEHLWPETGLAGEGWAVAGGCVTAADLGGDYHDWMQLPDGRVMLAVGDVAGHGIPAALVTAAAKVELGMQIRGLCGPGETLGRMNTAFAEQAGRVRPMSLWLGLYSPSSGVLHAADAGHPFAVLALPDGTTELVGKPGYPLGSRRTASYPESVLVVPPGGRLVLYSDGLPEAVDPAGTPFGYDRLRETIAGCRQEPPAVLVDRLLATMAAWSGQAVPADDQTVVVLARHAAAQGTEAGG
ncbi:MAG TPA: SpoIIE family protein phosphatase [Candidatus Ozemobacteraceae bacterium]|nr:SpoIIE family protein phosphatase [Candidatus Ozemobacteraceae bacterium]